MTRTRTPWCVGPVLLSVGHNVQKFNHCNGRSCTARTWRMTSIAFEDLVERLRTPVRTPESVTEYASMSKDERQRDNGHGDFEETRRRTA